MTRIKSLQNLGSDRELHSTERSILNNSEMSASMLKYKFGESDKKMKGSPFFSSLL